MIFAGLLRKHLSTPKEVKLIKTEYCYKCGEKMVLKTVETYGYDSKTGKRRTQEIQFCPAEKCLIHIQQLENYFCPVQIKTGYHDEGKGFFSFLKNSCSGCGYYSESY